MGSFKGFWKKVWPPARDKAQMEEASGKATDKTGEVKLASKLASLKLEEAHAIRRAAEKRGSPRLHWLADAREAEAELWQAGYTAEDYADMMNVAKEEEGGDGRSGT